MSATKKTNQSFAGLDNAAWKKVKTSIDNAVSYFNATHLHPFTKEQMEDISQDIIMHVMERIYKFDHSKSSLNTWLSKVAHNYCVDSLKKPSVSFLSFDDVENNTSLRNYLSPEDKYIEMERLESENIHHQWLISSLDSLKPREKEVMSLTLQGYKPREIARILNATPNSISIAKCNAQHALCNMARF